VDGPKLALVKRTKRDSNIGGVPNVSGLINLKVYKGNKGWYKYENTSRDVRKTL
jgi:hypothetical protein